MANISARGENGEWRAANAARAAVRGRSSHGCAMRARKRMRSGRGSTSGIMQRRTQMPIDFSRLTPAPWCADDGSRWGEGPHEVTGEWKDGGRMVASGISNSDDAEFIALARNAFEVMTRRKWTPIFSTSGWYVLNADFELAMDLPEDDHRIFFGDAFTAVVESERWLIEHESTPKENANVD
jgi:hypothetical protein